MSAFFRKRIEQTIEFMIQQLDEMDADPDLEGDPAEEEHDLEADPAEDGLADNAALMVVLTHAPR